MDITIAICTYNRCENLRRTLESLTRLEVPAGLEWELLVIDNNSHDQTKQVVESFAERLPVRYVFETQQGHTYARNRAIQEMRGDLLLFTDDDVEVDAGWVKAMWQAARDYPESAFFGGKVLPLWECERPAWFDLDALPPLRDVIVYAAGSDESYPYSENLTPIGANMAFRRWVFDKVGLFRTDLGRKGFGTEGGDEAEFCRRLSRVGVEGVFVPAAVVHHSVPPERCTKRYVWDWHISYGRAWVRIHGVPMNRKLVWLPIRLARIAAHALAAAAATLRRREIEQVYHLTRIGFNWGQALEAWSSRRRRTTTIAQGLESAS